MAIVDLGPRPRVALLLSTGLPLVLALALVQGYRSEQHGYFAGFWFLPAAALAVVGTLGALPLLFFRDVRWIGVLVVASSLSVPIIFMIGAKVAGSLGLLAWQKNEMIPFGPDLAADLVVVFKEGVSEDQIQGLRDTVLGVSGLCSYQLVLPEQTKHGLESVAVSYCNNVPLESRRSIRAAILKSELVHGVYEDIAPVELQLPADDRGGSSPSQPEW